MLCLVARCRHDVVLFPLPARPADLGSTRDNEIWLPFDGVSRRHALLTPDSRGVMVTDLHSKNGLVIDGSRVDELLLVPGRYVRIGRAMLGIEEHPGSDLVAAFPSKVVLAASRHSRTTGSVDSHSSERDAVRLMARLQRSPKLARRRPQALLVDVRRTLGASAVEWIDAEDGTGIIAAAGTIAEAVRDEILAIARQRQCDQEIRRIRGTSVLLTSALNPLRVLVAAFAGRARMVAEWERSFFEFIADKLLRPECDRERQTSRPHRTDTDVAAPSFLFASRKMEEIDALALLAAEGARPVLLLGETGVGKEIVARRIHDASSRARKPFVTVSCTTLSEHLLESELFGIEARVATGVDARPGLFDAAEGGTLFIDEIGESPKTQAALLRVLQCGEIRSVGGHAMRRADTRILLATRRTIGDGESEVRPDLAFRCDRIEIPPLRERREEVRALAHHFVERACENAGLGPVALSVKALATLESYDWPGNVRELECEIIRAVERHGRKGRMLHAAHFTIPAAAHAVQASRSIHDRADAARRESIEAALRQTDGNKAAAARLLGMSRNGLSKTMARLAMVTAPP